MGAWSVNFYLWCLNPERTRNWVKAVLVATFTILTSEVHLEECKWSVFWTLCTRSTARPRQHDTLGLVFERNYQLQWHCSLVFHSAVLSARHGPHSKVWLCRCWQGDDWCCSSRGTCQQPQSALTWAGQEDDRGGGSDTSAEDRRRWRCLQSSLPFQNTPRVASSFPCLSFQTQTEQSTIHLSHMGSVNASAIRFCLLETYQNIQSSRLFHKGRLLFHFQLAWLPCQR